MSELLGKDLEEDIPANEIIAYETSTAESKEQRLRSDDSNLIEFLLHNELEEGVVEYLEYSDDEHIAQVIGENALEHHVKSEPDNDFDDENQMDQQELYHCSTCDVKFYSVQDHLDRFHKDQDVVFDGFDKDKNNFNSIEDTIKKEYLEEDTASNSGEPSKCDNSAKAEILSEEEYFDIHGRQYVKKKVRIFDIDVENLKNESVTNEGTFITKDESGGNRETSEPLYACPECHVVFRSPRSLSSHLRVHKTSRKEKKAEIDPVQVNTKCEICNTTFRSMKSLKLHKRMHDPVKTKPIEDAIGYELKSVYKDGTQKEIFHCEICDKSYDKIFEEIHQKAHINEPKFLCLICNKKFINKENLSMHMKIHQDTNKPKGMTKAEKNGITLPYACRFCGRQFGRPHEKVKHERIHTGEKPYKCEICGKCFRVSYCLTLHLRTHTGARPYVCPHCNKRFKAYSVYNHHLMTHSEDRPYKCPYCPKAFKTSVQLGGHKNSHTKPFSCTECNRPFSSLYAVKAHMETHKKTISNLKHRCEICGAIYARLFALRDHMKEAHALNETIIVDNVNEIVSQNLIIDNDEEITVGDMDHFQAEEIVVTDWLK